MNSLAMAYSSSSPTPTLPPGARPAPAAAAAAAPVPLNRLAAAPPAPPSQYDITSRPSSLSYFPESAASLAAKGADNHAAYYHADPLKPLSGTAPLPPSQYASYNSDASYSSSAEIFSAQHAPQQHQHQQQQQQQNSRQQLQTSTQQYYQQIAAVAQQQAIPAASPQESLQQQRQLQLQLQQQLILQQSTGSTQASATAAAAAARAVAVAAAFGTGGGGAATPSVAYTAPSAVPQRLVPSAVPDKPASRPGSGSVDAAELLRDNPAVAKGMMYNKVMADSYRNSTHAADGDTLTSFEQELLDEISQARTNPSMFALHLLNERRPYFRGTILQLPASVSQTATGVSVTALQTREGVAAVDDAIQFLNTVQPMAPLLAVDGMCVAARVSLTDTIKGYAPSTTMQRIKATMDVQGDVIELVNIGRGSARELVSRLVVCDGDPKRSQRRVLFDDKWKQVGVGYAENKLTKKYMFVLVLGYGIFAGSVQ